METEALKRELYGDINEAVAALDGLISSLDENKINTIPYAGSWTAGQLIRHITKSTDGMAKVMRAESKPAERAIDERAAELKKIFLDFSSNLQSPDFIVPEDRHYEKLEVIKELNSSFEQFRESTDKANLSDLVEGLPFGAVTKLELLHFVLYHTQRHLHQMKRIYDALEGK